jgi:UDP-N-acetylmuramoylalanine--D-glutamate ligase
MRAGGNWGPRRSICSMSGVELYMLELSSFQLETTDSLSLAAATVLNVTPDHLDRYADLEAYAAAKARIFARCEVAVINLDDPLVAAMVGPGAAALSFSLRADVGADYALMQRDGGDWWLMRHGEPLLALSQMRLTGAAQRRQCARGAGAGEALALPRARLLAALRASPGSRTARSGWPRSRRALRQRFQGHQRRGHAGRRGRHARAAARDRRRRGQGPGFHAAARRLQPARCAPRC